VNPANRWRRTCIGALGIAGVLFIVLGIHQTAEARGGAMCFTTLRELVWLESGGSQVQFTIPTLAFCSTCEDPNATCAMRNMGQSTYLGAVVDVKTCVCFVTDSGGNVVVFPTQPHWPGPPPLAMACDEAVMVAPGTGAFVHFPGCMGACPTGGECEETGWAWFSDPAEFPEPEQGGPTATQVPDAVRDTLGCDCYGD
jgi:hypothetical protein